MMGSSSSSSSDKSSVIHSNVKETIVHTYSDVLETVNEKIFARFRKTLIKTPVVFVDSQIPTEVLDWYKTYVFGQTKDKVEQKSRAVVKETPKESINTGANKATEKDVVDNKKINENVPVTKDDEISGMDVEVAKEALEESFRIETNQSVSILSEESSKQSIKNGDKIDDENDKNDKNENVNITEETKLNSNVTKEDEVNLMDFEEIINQPKEESTKPLSSNQTSMQPSKPKIELNLQLSEESSNESSTMDKSEDLNEEIMETLISNVLATIADEKRENNGMEIEETQQKLVEGSSQLESNQSSEKQPELTKTGSSLHLSEESSNDSTDMDKKDNENNDKMQNIKFNPNVFAAIEDENNLLDFEDI